MPKVSGYGVGDGRLLRIARRLDLPVLSSPTMTHLIQEFGQVTNI